MPAVWAGALLAILAAGQTAAAPAEDRPAPRNEPGLHELFATQAPFTGILAQETRIGASPRIQLFEVAFDGERRFRIRVLSPTHRAGDLVLVSPDRLRIYSAAHRALLDIEPGEPVMRRRPDERPERGEVRERADRARDARKLAWESPIFKLGLVMKRFDLTLIGEELEPVTGRLSNKHLARPPDCFRASLRQEPGPRRHRRGPEPPPPGMDPDEFEAFIWIDSQHNIPLRFEALDPDQRMIETVFFAEISFHNLLGPEEFTFEPGPEDRVFSDFAQFRRAVSPPPEELGRIPGQGLPPGFRFTGASPVDFGEIRAVQMKYEYETADGRRVPVSVFAVPLPGEPAHLDEIIARRIQERVGRTGLNWAEAVHGDRFVFAVGEPEAEILSLLIAAPGE